MFNGSATVHVDAAPEEVWALVTDVTRMGEWSPETYRAEWRDGATGPVVGARFKGWNRDGWMRWSTSPKVTAVVPGRSWTFSTGSTDWTYEVAPGEGGGTSLTERYDVTKYNALFRIVAPVSKRKAALDDGIRRTLERIKAAAEAAAVR